MADNDSDLEATRLVPPAVPNAAGLPHQADFAQDSTRVVSPGDQSIVSLRTGIEIQTEVPERYKIGDRIGDRYEVLAVHRGSMGVVYGTFDHRTKLPRALKGLQARLAHQTHIRNLFVEEAALWVRLEKHPFIVRAYLVEKFGGDPYVITEYIRGREGMGSDLRAWLGHPRLTQPVAIEIALQIAQGMQHATRKVPGLVHRDLKPANVLVDDRARALVTDFGLVYANQADAGTPAYMAPEQWLSRRLDQRTDIYAFGCILYEMFTGHRMFAATTHSEWKAAHLGHVPHSLRHLRRDLSPETEDFVLRCLAKDIEARPQSWNEVVDECASWFYRLTGQPAVLDFDTYQLTADELLSATYSLSQLAKHDEVLEICDRVLALNPS